jgi:uncharacterized protein YbjQ (UPF0145 family)
LLKNQLSLIKHLIMVDENLITTANNLEGYHITKQLGIIRGITVRSRGIGGNFVGGLQTMFGGKISIYANLCEKARVEAYDLMIQHASEKGANAIINMRYDANEVMAGVTEILAYGTAVFVEKI